MLASKDCSGEKQSDLLKVTLFIQVQLTLWDASWMQGHACDQNLEPNPNTMELLGNIYQNKACKKSMMIMS